MDIRAEYKEYEQQKVGFLSLEQNVFSILWVGSGGVSAVMT